MFGDTHVENGTHTLGISWKKKGKKSNQMAGFNPLAFDMMKCANARVQSQNELQDLQRMLLKWKTGIQNVS